MGKVKVVVIGAGLRGTYAYTPYIYENTELCEIVGVVEPKKSRRDLFSQIYNVEKKYIFENIEDFFKCDKIADAVIITTNEDRHYEPVKLALEKGYNILLEKPMANSLDSLVHINELCEKHQDKVFMVCHVLRYTPFFSKLREIVESKKLGELISIQHNENIGYWHFAHSYTRGNWRNSSDTSPLILSKSCHDMDIILYLVGSNCKKISSFGSLKHFNKENFKENMGENCYDCKVEECCPYSAKKIYIEDERDINNAVHINPTKKNITEILKKGPYGRCVYKCDNNVVDNMVNILEFNNGVTATFNLSAFTKECDRTIKLMFSHGEVGGSLMNNEIRVKKFGKNEETIINPCNVTKGHVGGDISLIEDFIKVIDSNNTIHAKTTAKESIQSHIMAFAAEYSRVSEEVVYIDDFFKNATNMTHEIENTLL